jgi:hypothetical protein
MKLIIEHIAFWTAASAALLLAFNIPISGWAFVLHLIANIASLYLLKQSNVSKALYYQILVFMVANLIGISRWLL